MADIEQALFAILSGDAGVSALVGTRIYPVMAAQSGTGDYVRYAKVSGVPYHTHEKQVGLRWGRFSFICHASRYAGCKAIADAVLDALDMYTGTVSGVVVGACLSQEEVDLEFDDEARVYGRAVDFMIQYSE